MSSMKWVIFRQQQQCICKLVVVVGIRVKEFKETYFEIKFFEVPMGHSNKDLQQRVKNVCLKYRGTFNICYEIRSDQISRSVVSDSLRPHGLQSSWDSPGPNTGVGSSSLLQGIFPTQGLNQGLLHHRQILYQLSHQGSPRIRNGQSIPSPVDLPDPGIELGSLALQADSLPAERPDDHSLRAAGHAVGETDHNGIHS